MSESTLNLVDMDAFDGVEPTKRLISVSNWLRLQNLFTQAQVQDRSLSDMQDRLNRQGKWIAFLVVSWVFAMAFIGLAVLMAG